MSRSKKTYLSDICAQRRHKSTCVRLRCPHEETLHYENTPIQINRKFHLQKLKKFKVKNYDIFYISAQNIDCGTR